MKVHILWCKTVINSWSLSEKLPLTLKIMKIHFQFHFFAIWSNSTSILLLLVWKALASNQLLKSLPSFSKLIPSVLGHLVNVKIPERFLCRRSVFSDFLSVSCDYAFIKQLRVNFLSEIKERFKNDALQGSLFSFFSQAVRDKCRCIFSNSLLLKVHRSSIKLKIFEIILTFRRSRVLVRSCYCLSQWYKNKFVIKGAG